MPLLRIDPPVAAQWLLALGYTAQIREGLWVELVVQRGAEQWWAKGADAAAAWLQILGQMFPSHAAQEALFQALAGSAAAEDAPRTAQSLTQSAQAAPQGAQVAPQSAQAAAESVQAAPRGAPVVAQSAQVVAQSAQVVPKGGQDALQSAQVVPQSAQVAAEGAQIAAESAQVAAESAKVAPQSAPVVAQSAQDVPKGGQDVLQSTQVAPQSAQVAVESAQAALRSAQVATESAQAGPKSAQAALGSTQAAPQSTEAVPQNTQAAPQSAQAAAESVQAAPQGVQVAPQGAPVVAQSAEAVPQNMQAAPQGGQDVPQSAQATPQGAQVAAESVQVAAESAQGAAEDVRGPLGSTAPAQAAGAEELDQSAIAPKSLSEKTVHVQVLPAVNDPELQARIDKENRKKSREQAAQALCDEIKEVQDELALSVPSLQQIKLLAFFCTLQSLKDQAGEGDVKALQWAKDRLSTLYREWQPGPMLIFRPNPNPNEGEAKRQFIEIMDSELEPVEHLKKKAEAALAELEQLCMAQESEQSAQESEQSAQESEQSAQESEQSAQESEQSAQESEQSAQEGEQSAQEGEQSAQESAEPAQESPTPVNKVHIWQTLQEVMAYLTERQQQGERPDFEPLLEVLSAQAAESSVQLAEALEKAIDWLIQWRGAAYVLEALQRSSGWLDLQHRCEDLHLLLIDHYHLHGRGSDGYIEVEEQGTTLDPVEYYPTQKQADQRLKAAQASCEAGIKNQRDNALSSLVLELRWIRPAVSKPLEWAKVWGQLRKFLREQEQGLRQKKAQAKRKGQHTPTGGTAGGVRYGIVQKLRYLNGREAPSEGFYRALAKEPESFVNVRRRAKLKSAFFRLPEGDTAALIEWIKESDDAFKGGGPHKAGWEQLLGRRREEVLALELDDPQFKERELKNLCSRLKKVQNSLRDQKPLRPEGAQAPLGPPQLSQEEAALAEESDETRLSPEQLSLLASLRGRAALVAGRGEPYLISGIERHTHLRMRHYLNGPRELEGLKESVRKGGTDLILILTSLIGHKVSDQARRIQKGSPHVPLLMIKQAGGLRTVLLKLVDYASQLQAASNLSNPISEESPQSTARNGEAP